MPAGVISRTSHRLLSRRIVSPIPARAAHILPISQPARHFCLKHSEAAVPGSNIQQGSRASFSRPLSTVNMSDEKKIERNYRFRRSDFGDLTVRPLHFDLHVDLIETRALVTLRATYIYQTKHNEGPLKQIKLNSKDLDIKSVEIYASASPLSVSISPNNALLSPSSQAFDIHLKSLKQPIACHHEVDTKDDFLIVEIPPERGIINNGDQFVLRTVSVAKPTENILEGIYYDYTPTGAPRTMITQCQQYGFQRIVPCIDTMNAKTFYTTTIVADTRYTNIITNGDLAPGFYDPNTMLPIYHDAPTPPADVDSGLKRHMLTYHNHQVCMAPYLFFLGVGTYVTHRRTVEYPDGDTFALELLTFPNLVEDKHARVAINALHDSVLWNYLNCGPEATEHEAERKEIWSLIDERERIKESNDASQASHLATIRQRLKTLIGVWNKTGYKYTGQVYREIGMENSDYGGMENVGNTTILSSRLVPSDHLTDPAYVYMEGVKIHEYYHNINGSQVTGQSPFEIWLNEAVTVHIQRQREDMLFGADYMRLKQVIYALMPASGPLALDRAATSMAIEPEGFNRTQELISAMTYSKAPEFVRMIELLLTKPVFNRGLDLYHTKFAYSNATTMDWIEAMEEVSGLQLKAMADGWLKRTSYPEVTFTTTYNTTAKTYTVDLRQTGSLDARPWDFPIDWALVSNGINTHTGVFRFNTETSKLLIIGVEKEPDFISFARNWSYFGTYKHENASRARLQLQALSDPDVINRYLAYRTIADSEKANIIGAILGKNKDYHVSKEWVALHAKILFDNSITPSTRSLILREADEISSRPELGHYYIEISDARVALLQAVYDEHAQQLIELYSQLELANVPGPHKQGLHERSLKQHVYQILNAGSGMNSILNTRKIPNVHVDTATLAKDLVIRSTFMTDRVFGFQQFLQSRATPAEKQQILQQIRETWSKHPDTIESYVTVIGSLDTDDAPTMIHALLNDSLFNINLAGHARGVARGWSALRKRSLLTQPGLDLTVDLFVRIGVVNQMSAYPILSAFNDLPKFTGDTRSSLIAALQKMRSSIDAVKQQSLYNQLTTILSGVGIK